MHRYIFLAAVLSILAVIGFGCSGGGSPTGPALPNDGVLADSEAMGKTVCLGLWQIAVDLEAETIEAVQTRQADLILNVLGFMEPPALDKLTLDFDTLQINFEQSTVEADIIFIHPLVEPNNVFHGFDVRGIVFGPNLLNADGYTPVMNPADFADVPFGYMDGLLGAPNDYAHYDAPYWPYKYFCDGLDGTTELWEFFSVPANLNERGIYREGQQHTRHYSLSWAGLEDPINFLVFNYAVYANFDWPVGVPPHELDDFSITTANSAEAFCLSYAYRDNTLTYYKGTGSGEITLDIHVWDWQGPESSEVTIESLEPGVLGPVSSETWPPGTDPFDNLITFEAIPGEPTTTGDLDLLVTVTDKSRTYGEAWFFGFLPETHSYYYEYVRANWIITVPVSDYPPCPTIEPVDIEKSPYNGQWFDDLTEDTACACEVENDGGTDNYWTHDPPNTAWRSGHTGGQYDANMDTTLIGPRILAPSTGAIEFDFHFDSSLDASDDWDGVTVGYKLNDDEVTLTLTQGNSVTNYHMGFKMGGLEAGIDEVSWAINFHSDGALNTGTGCVLFDVTSTVYDPGPLPEIKDGGSPNPNNEICAIGSQVTWLHFVSGGNHYVYHYWSPPPISFTWGGNPTTYWTIGDCGWMFPAYTVSNYTHRECRLDVVDRLIPFGDFTATASGGGLYDPNITDGAGEVFQAVMDFGTATERWVFQYCDVGQMDEGDTCNYRVIINGSNNSNPSDMRIEWLEVGSHNMETDEDHTGSYMVWNGLYLPIQCDYLAWTNDTAVDIDQP